jgi:hypothetical protein
MLVYIAQRDWDEIITNTVVGVSLFEAGAFISITPMIFSWIFYFVGKYDGFLEILN